MKSRILPLLGVLVVLVLLALSGCATYQKADEYIGQVRSIAVLPLVIGDEHGRIDRIGAQEAEQFQAYFTDNFYTAFREKISFGSDVKVLLPGDYDESLARGTDYLAIASALGVDAVLGINLTVYNEVTPAAAGLEVAGAVVTALLFGSYAHENVIAGYDLHYAYLGIEDAKAHVSVSLPQFQEIDQQRRQFVDNLVQWIDTSFPLSVNYRRS